MGKSAGARKWKAVFLRLVAAVSEPVDELCSTSTTSATPKRAKTELDQKSKKLHGGKKCREKKVQKDEDVSDIYLSVSSIN